MLSICDIGGSHREMAMFLCSFIQIIDQLTQRIGSAEDSFQIKLKTATKRF